MNLIDWSASLSVNNDVLDSQHKKMLSIVNKLHDALIKGRSNEIIRDVLEELVDYTQTHFADEEKFFDELDYPCAEEHKRQHKEFVSKITEFQNDFLEGKIALSIDVMEFLVGWFLMHIQRVDHGYAKIISKKS